MNFFISIIGFYSRRGIILYLEYQSVCPFVRIGSLRPLSRKLQCPPLGTEGGERQHSLVVEGAGVEGVANSDHWRESLALCLFCASSSQLLYIFTPYRLAARSMLCKKNFVFLTSIGIDK
jgi:hypothetical protein